MLETEYEIKYNKYRLRALREEYDDDEALNRDIAKKIDDIYFKVVPPDVKVAVESDVDQAREQEWFEKNTFSIICLSDEDEERPVEAFIQYSTLQFYTLTVWKVW